jgi:TPR repeat protein
VKYYFNEPRIRWRIFIATVMVIIMVAGGYFAWRVSRQDVPVKEKDEPAQLPRMANLPPKKDAPKPAPPPYSSDAPLLERVREAMRKGIDPEGAVALAKSLPDKPERADAAFILLEYAAEAEHAEAALLVAQYFDPTYTEDSGTIIKNPAAAFEWYRAALSGGQQQAKNHLSGLKQWVEKEALLGSAEARELINHWQ